MAFQLSPGVLVTERDLTAVVPAVSTTAGGFAGAFQWGPVDEVITVDSENSLVEKYGRPDNDTFKPFFTAANFLSYGNNLQVVRSVNYGAAKNAVTNSDNAVSTVTLTNLGTDYSAAARQNTTATVVTTGASQPTTNATLTINFDTTNSIVSSLSLTEAGSGYTAAAIANTTIVIETTGASQPTTNATAILSFEDASPILIRNEVHYDNTYADGAGTVGEWAAKYPGDLGNGLKVSFADGNSYSGWLYGSLFDAAPGTSTYASTLGASHDEMHIIVIDSTGVWTGAPGTTLEKFPYVSKAVDAKNADGSSAYYKDVINNTSKYIWWMDHTVEGSNWGTKVTSGKLFANLSANVTVTLAGGADGYPTAGNIQSSYAILSNDELYDVSLVLGGDASQSTASFIINSVAETRKDCVAFLSPEMSDVVNQAGQEATNIVAFRDTLPSSSYAVLDSGWKYQYDRYNDVYRWVPLNGDTAGLAVRTDFVADPWFSPAGLNRGQIKNVVKLAYSPTKTDRDTLYKKGINPVVSLPGLGTVLFGDKTLLAKPSAFDRINVRRLFIVLEKAIATAAKFQLFEFNDEFTRAQFRSLVEPFLRNVQGRRGVTDFLVVCDNTNNTGEVIDRNEFVADIYVKPTRSINFIQLNFIATRTGISFQEVGA